MDSPGLRLICRELLPATTVVLRPPTLLSVAWVTLPFFQLMSATKLTAKLQARITWVELALRRDYQPSRGTMACRAGSDPI